MYAFLGKWFGISPREVEECSMIQLRAMLWLVNEARER